jgi:hypothetical protein
MRRGAMDSTRTVAATACNEEHAQTTWADGHTSSCPARRHPQQVLMSWLVGWMQNCDECVMR